MIEIETLGKPISVFDKHVGCAVIQILLEKSPEDGIERNANCGFPTFLKFKLKRNKR